MGCLLIINKADQVFEYVIFHALLFDNSMRDTTMQESVFLSMGKWITFSSMYQNQNNLHLTRVKHTPTYLYIKMENPKNVILKLCCIICHDWHNLYEKRTHKNHIIQMCKNIKMNYKDNIKGGMREESLDWRFTGGFLFVCLSIIYLLSR